MKTFVVVFACTISLLISSPAIAEKNPVCNISENQAKSHVKEDLMTRYPNKYALIQTLLNANIEDYHNLCQVPDTEPHHNILADLNSRYQYKYSMIWTLYQSNIKAYRELQ